MGRPTWSACAAPTPTCSPAEPPAGGDLRYPAPQELVVENLLDLTHLDIVHGAIFGDPLGGVEELTVEHTDEVIVMRRISRDRRPPKMLRHAMGNPERQDIVQTFHGHVRSGVTFGIVWNTPPGWGSCLLHVQHPGNADDHARDQRDPGDRRTLVVPEDRADPCATKIVARQDERILRRQTPRYRTDDPRDRAQPAGSTAWIDRSIDWRLGGRDRGGDRPVAEQRGHRDEQHRLHAGGQEPREAGSTDECGDASEQRADHHGRPVEDGRDGEDPAVERDGNQSLAQRRDGDVTGRDAHTPDEQSRGGHHDPTGDCDDQVPQRRGGGHEEQHDRVPRSRVPITGPAPRFPASIPAPLAAPSSP